MSSLSIVEAKLPPGFRFHPRDEELICDYLMRWMSGSPHPLPLLLEVDLNKCEPWDIPRHLSGWASSPKIASPYMYAHVFDVDTSVDCHFPLGNKLRSIGVQFACVGGKEWYFYSQRDRKYATGLRTNRATVSGYWKATGKDRAITRKGTLVGMRKTLVFYQGRAPKGRKTDWVMHEFRAEGPGPKSPSPLKEDWVLCRVFFKSRSEIPAAKTEEAGGNSYDAVAAQSLPPLTEPAGFFAFDQYHEQVPCFSNIYNNQITNPSFALMEPPQPNMFGDLGISYGGGGDSSSSCDKKMIKDVLNQLTKMEDNEMTTIKGGSPSFGEGSSDSYLSEVVWNNYS